jgi:hypothetical protein
MRRRTRGLLFALLLLLGACQEFAETVVCIPPSVLDENDDCVRPPLPDAGGVADAGAPDAGVPDAGVPDGGG